MSPDHNHVHSFHSYVDRDMAAPKGKSIEFH